MFFNKKSYLLLDIGGTNIRIGVSGDLKNIKSSKTIPTNLNFEQALKEIKAIVDELAPSTKIQALSSGVRALNKEKTALIDHPHFPMWVNKPLKKSLEELFNCPVFLENDAAMNGLGEAVFGPGKNKKIVAFHTVSTGIGGARIVNGMIDQNSLGFEPGNQIIDADGSLLNRKEPIYLEGYISGTALEERFGKKNHENEDPKVWKEATEILAMGLNNTLVYWSPDLIILGGSLMKRINLNFLKAEMKKVVKIFSELPDIVLTELEDKSGLYGAMAHLKKIKF